MPFISTPVVTARRDVQLEVIEDVLRNCFAGDGVALMPQVRAIENYETLRPLYQRLMRAASLEEARQAVADARQAPPPDGGSNGP